MAARTDEPKIPLGVRFPESDHTYIRESAEKADIDMSHMVRRMVALCRREYPNGFTWIPGVGDSYFPMSEYQDHRYEHEAAA